MIISGLLNGLFLYFDTEGIFRENNSFNYDLVEIH